MFPIFAITTDPRALTALESCQEEFRIRFDVVSDFDQGLKNIFAKRFRLIFVQKELEGVSANVVARHVKGLLRNESPVLVVLCDGPCQAEPLKHTFDDAIDLTRPALELELAFSRHIERVVMEEDGGSQQQLAGESPLVPTSPEGASEESESFSFSSSAADDEPPPLVQGSLLTGGAASPPYHPLPPEPAIFTEAPGGATGEATGTEAEEPEPIVVPPEVSGYDIGLEPRRGKSLQWALLVVLLAAAAWYGYPHLHDILTPLGGQGTVKEVPPPAPVSSPPVPQSPQRPAVSLALPAMLEGTTVDVSYTSNHPGWERRVGKGVEFRIFRETEAIKAIQAFSVGRQGLSDDLLHSLLSQATGNSTVTAIATIERNGYRIEQGTVGEVAEVELYHHLGNRQLRGFVLTVR